MVAVFLVADLAAEVLLVVDQVSEVLVDHNILVDQVVVEAHHNSIMNRNLVNQVVAVVVIQTWIYQHFQKMI